MRRKARPALRSRFAPLRDRDRLGSGRLVTGVSLAVSRRVAKPVNLCYRNAREPLVRGLAVVAVPRRLSYTGWQTSSFDISLPLPGPYRYNPRSGLSPAPGSGPSWGQIQDAPALPSGSGPGTDPGSSSVRSTHIPSRGAWQLPKAIGFVPSTAMPSFTSGGTTWCVKLRK
jgi:hypothetical protein